MKHIVFMVRNYYPYNSAVGVCIGNVAESLSQNHKVTIICEKTFLDEEDNELIKNQNIVRIISKSTLRRKKIENLLKSKNSIVKRIGESISFINRLIEYIVFILSKYSVQDRLSEDYFHALIKIKEPIDIVVPSCMPFETLLAANKFKKENACIQVVPFLFDKFSENATLHRTLLNKKIKMKNNLKLERKVFLESDRILFTPSWEEHLNKNFLYMKEKFKKVEHPLLKYIKSNNLVTYDHEKINIVYTGTVVINNRNPKTTLEIFDYIISRNSKIVLHFYAMGNAVNLIKDFQKEHYKNVLYHGQVKTDVAHSAINNSTMLLSIGNIDETQTPSKIFEYISSCKPIIHIAQSENDPVIDILSHYPIACCVNTTKESYEEQINKIEKFINSKVIKDISFDELEDIFHDALPTFSVKQILND